jgi:hypothetical protein
MLLPLPVSPRHVTTTLQASQPSRVKLGVPSHFDGDRAQGRAFLTSCELLMFHSKIYYVPKDRELRRYIIEQHHDTRIARHAGHFKTLELISRNYWWPQMSHYIGVYVKICDLCNQTKVQWR